MYEHDAVSVALLIVGWSDEKSEIQCSEDEDRGQRTQPWCQPTRKIEEIFC